MPGSRDPVERAADGSVDLYDVSTWEPRSAVDRLAVRLYRIVGVAVRVLPVLVSTLLLVFELQAGLVSAVVDDEVRLLVALSVVPAFLIAAFVRYSDVTENEPLGVLFATFVLTVVLGPLAGVFNVLVPIIVVALVVGILGALGGLGGLGEDAAATAGDLAGAVLAPVVDAGHVLVADLAVHVGSHTLSVHGVVLALGPDGVVLQASPEAWGTLVALVLQGLYFYLVVGPVEESVKLLAVRLYAYRNRSFDAVVDGAVYGAVAGLGFATVENALYITRALEQVSQGTDVFGGGGIGITAVRSLAGPGHVLYSGIAGYYLGLAKFSDGDTGPIVVKGLLLASVFHGTYNMLVGIVPQALSNATGLPAEASIFLFIVVYDGALGLFLYRKIRRYRDTYNAVDAAEPDEHELTPDRTEFDPDNQKDPYSQ
jgi:RsiW-degrading membrane proteinase PrsW (M82 family)